MGVGPAIVVQSQSLVGGLKSGTNQTLARVFRRLANETKRISFPVNTQRKRTKERRRSDEED